MGRAIVTALDAPASILDWITEPTPTDKKANCGKLTQITVYTNGTISVKAFYCHRYDCPRRGSERKSEIKRTILALTPMWYAVTVSERDYDAVRKRIVRAGEKYCAVGNGDKILMLTLKPVIEGSKLTALSRLENLIDEHLECPYTYRHRRFRHSNGLFPAKRNSLIKTHIKRKFAVAEPKDTMVARFTDNGYSQGTYGKECFLRPMWSKHSAEEILCHDVNHIVWAEQ